MTEDVDRSSDERTTKDPLLLPHLRDLDPTLASYVDVIRIASEKLLRGSSTSDLTHAEEVHRRLSGLCFGVQPMPLSVLEEFILLAACYLHDIGKSKTSTHKRSKNKNRRHGQRSADSIRRDKKFEFLFPCTQIQDAVADVVMHHDARQVGDIGKLDERDELDLRWSTAFTIRNRSVRPQFMAAFLRLADELECTCERTRLSKPNDSRNCIRGIHIDGQEISCEFRRNAKAIAIGTCFKYLQDRVARLKPFLSKYGIEYVLKRRSAARGTVVGSRAGNAVKTGEAVKTAVGLTAVRTKRVSALISEISG